MNLGNNRQGTIIQWRKNVLKREGLAVIPQVKCLQLYNFFCFFTKESVKLICEI